MRRRPGGRRACRATSSPDRPPSRTATSTPSTAAESSTGRGAGRFCRSWPRRCRGATRTSSPTSPTAIVTRVLTNLATAYRRAGDRAGLCSVLRLRLELPDATPQERRELGVLLGAVGSLRRGRHRAGGLARGPRPGGGRPPASPPELSRSLRASLRSCLRSCAGRLAARVRRGAAPELTLDRRVKYRRRHDRARHRHPGDRRSHRPGPLPPAARGAAPEGHGSRHLPRSPVRPRPGLGPLPRGPRGPRAVAPAPAHDQRDAHPGRRADRRVPQRDRARHGRAHPGHPRHGQAEGALPAAALHR